LNPQLPKFANKAASDLTGALQPDSPDHGGVFAAFDFFRQPTTKNTKGTKQHSVFSGPLWFNTLRSSLSIQTKNLLVVRAAAFLRQTTKTRLFVGAVFFTSAHGN
jgi:hypothetical protein